MTSLLAFACRCWVALSWLVMALVGALLLLVLWPFLKDERRVQTTAHGRGIKPQSRQMVGEYSPEPPYAQRDLGDESDIVAEGLGWNLPLVDLVYDRIQVRPPDRTREKHHPLGHRTRSFACLPDAEGQIWKAAIRASTR